MLYFQKYLFTLVCVLATCMYVCVPCASLVLTETSVGGLDSWNKS